MDYYIHGIGESISLLSEAARKSATNQAHVAASTLGKTSDHAAAQIQAWENPFNSYANAVAGIVGNTTEQPVVTGCETDPTSPSVRRAVGLLRAARVESIFDENAPARDVVEDVRDALQREVEGNAPVEPEDYLRRRGITLMDIELARYYLAEEEAALDRVHLPDHSADPDGPPRIHGLRSRTLQHSAAYYQGHAVGSAPPPADNGDTDLRSYTGRSAVHAIDVMRFGANAVLKLAAATHHDKTGLLLTEDQRATLARASLAANLLVGTRRLWV